MKLSPQHLALLKLLAAGHTLKAHRDVDGHKEFRLHYADGRPSEPLDRRVADELAEQGFIDSNKKFPAASFWLTERGRAAVSRAAPG